MDVNAKATFTKDETGGGGLVIDDEGNDWGGSAAVGADLVCEGRDYSR